MAAEEEEEEEEEEIEKKIKETEKKVINAAVAFAMGAAAGIATILLAEKIANFLLSVSSVSINKQ